MKKYPLYPVLSAALVTILVLLVAVCGCGGGPNEQARELLSEANSHLSAASEAAKKVEGFQEGWQELFSGEDVTAETLAGARNMLYSARENLTEALGEVVEATKAVEAAARLDLSEDMNEYLDLKQEALDEQEQMLKTGLKSINLQVQALSAYESGSQEQFLEYNDQILVLEEEAAEHARRALELHEQANAYYDGE